MTSGNPAAATDLKPFDERPGSPFATITLVSLRGIITSTGSAADSARRLDAYSSRCTHTHAYRHVTWLMTATVDSG